MSYHKQCLGYEAGEIRRCPFCGHAPRLLKTINFYKRGNSTMTPDHDFEVCWEVKCENCGTNKMSMGSTYYKLDDDGTFKIVPQSYNKEDPENDDKRREVIKRWNARYNCDEERDL